MSEQSTLVRPEPYDRFSGAHLAAAGFLARYSGRTRDAYAGDLRGYLAWCANRQLDVFAATRPHIELWVRWLEEDRHLAPATVARRLSTVIGFYRTLVIDGRLGQSPAQYVRHPHVSPDSQALGLDRLQLGSLVALARGSSPMDAALITLLGLRGLRVSEACSVDLQDFGTQRGHRTLHIIGKGGKPALIPLPPPVARTLDQAAAERTGGPLLLTRTGRRMDRYAASRMSAGCQAGRHRPQDRLPLPATLLHHRRPRRRRPATRCAGRRPTRRPPHHHPIRPSPRQPGPARQLHRRRLHRRRRLTGSTRTGISGWGRLCVRRGFFSRLNRRAR
jgi:site-specific recombinase XerC